MKTNHWNAELAAPAEAHHHAPKRPLASAWNARIAPSIDDVIGGGLLLTMLCAISVVIVEGSQLISA